MSATPNRIHQLVTPECENLSKTIKLSSLGSLILISIVVILMFVVIIIQYMVKKKTSDPPQMLEEKKKTTTWISALSLASFVVAVLLLFVTMWDVTVVSKTTNNCLKSR
uniref:GrBNV_gp95-like protein n=1 Tax=Nilaparvata lugens endogenous nudivirus TaxID=1487700 RepID=X5GY86_9VIRU|nr:GrBNV_gp95-like protein [Nilaparvata lugens endogenous nudivirus]